ncbi:AAA ATPase-like protein [Lacibacter cauensis]|uniref:AAA ATPase-like protein n=1 Tax=Lacibacter cauensis TaxID=510947 RepID=A0A562SWF2_9BACT|nr:AAA family ATPase [Lacibacter cauensis]TWI85615.1 AAA ATPase-like protein [Lacibacter cauensis]
MLLQLKRFEILGLHGDMDVKINIDDSNLIIVAENGLGKTTIVNIIYYTLSRQWYKLTEYHFETLIFEIGDNEFKVQREELNNFIKLRKLRNRSFRRTQSPRISRIADYILETHDIQALLNSPFELEQLASRFDVPVSVLFDISNELLFSTKDSSDNIDKISEILNKEIKSQILYLPTYRRIEKDLKNIFPDLETNLDSLRNKRLHVEQENSSKYIELVEFGMDDVQQKVERKLNSLYINFTNNLRQSLMGGYLRDILNKNYEKYNYNVLDTITSEKLNEILNRIDNSILQKNEKDSLSRFVDTYKTDPASITNESKIIAYFIQKLVDIYEKQSIAEQEVTSFVEICNSYCNNKKFIYSREERKIKVYLTQQEKEIDFSKLSSGEKQIVSLFSHLYLSDTKQFFVIIDEPELSLSVSWQERFLQDILNANNSGLIAVTHSPFIFNDSLIKHTKGFNEFISIK